MHVSYTLLTYFFKILSSILLKNLNFIFKDPRGRTVSDADNQRPIMPQPRNTAQSLKVLDQNNASDKLSIVTQMFWIAVSMFESDYEYEFYLAIRLLDKVSRIFIHFWYYFFLLVVFFFDCKLSYCICLMYHVSRKFLKKVLI